MILDLEKLFEHLTKLGISFHQHLKTWERSFKYRKQHSGSYCICNESELTMYLTICISILHVNQHSTLDCLHILFSRRFFQFSQDLLCAFVRL